MRWSLVFSELHWAEERKTAGKGILPLAGFSPSLLAQGSLPESYTLADL